MRTLRSHPFTALALAYALLLQAVLATLLAVSHAAAEGRTAWVICGQGGAGRADRPIRHGDGSCPFGMPCGGACASACSGCAPPAAPAPAWPAGDRAAVPLPVRDAVGHPAAFPGGRPGSRAPPGVL